MSEREKEGRKERKREERNERKERGRVRERGRERKKKIPGFVQHEAFSLIIGGHNPIILVGDDQMHLSKVPICCTGMHFGFTV